VDIRELCDQDAGGPRSCCGTRQLGPHAGDCRLSSAMQNGMADHEEMYRHAAEVPRSTVTVVSGCRYCHQVITRATGTAGPWRTLPDERVPAPWPEAAVRCPDSPGGHHAGMVNRPPDEESP
jgi:hypothetical protein